MVDKDHKIGQYYLAGDVTSHGIINRWIQIVVSRFPNLRNSKDDAIQETHIKVYQSLAAGLINVPLKEWTQKTARKICLQIIAKDKFVDTDGVSVPREVGMDPRELEQMSAEWDAGSGDKDEEDSQRLSDAIADLPERSREVIELRLRGLSFAEIAEALEITPNAAKKRSGLAQLQLKKRLT